MGKFKLNKRSLKYGSNSLILIAVVIAIAVVANLLVGMVDIKWDMSADKLYTISDESKKVIKDIKKEVTIYGLFDNGEIPVGNAYKDLINLLDQYKKLGIKIEYIDPDKDPGTITALGGKDNTKNIAKGDFVVKSGNKIKKLSATELYGENSEYGRVYTAEPLITGAIKYVTSEVTPIVYFIVGHGEASLEKDLTQIKSAFENNNLECKSLSLTSAETIPADAQIIVFTSPKSDLSETEKIKINSYIKNGGKSIFLFDPVETGNKFVNFEEVLAAYNIGINYDKVKEMDSDRYLTGDQYFIKELLETNDINKPFNSAGEYFVFMPDSRSLKVLKNEKEWLTTTSLIKSSTKAVASSVINAGSTENGPFDLAIASESGKSKVLAFGNATFIKDVALTSQYSQYFMLGANYLLSTVVNWMQDKEDETTIEPKMISQKTLSVTAGQSQALLIVLMGVLPLLIMTCGFIVWNRRRHL